LIYVWSLAWCENYTKVQEETNMDKWLELWLDETMKEVKIEKKEEEL